MNYTSIKGDGADIALYVGKAQKRSERERELRNKFEALKMERINKYQGVNLYVKNLDDQLNDDELREAFTTCGTITSCRIMKDPSGNSRGFGFVCFATPEEATKAVTDMNGKLVSGKPIYVALAQRKEVRRAQLEAQHAQQRASGMVVGRGMPMQQPPMYGAAPMFYAQPNQMPPQSRQGFVYPQQMMPRGGMPRGPMPYRQPGAPGPAGYGMPQYGIPRLDVIFVAMKMAFCSRVTCVASSHRIILAPALIVAHHRSLAPAAPLLEHSSS
uniref:RRM domain-containing protein n=1 Tax=Hucho hucho TaxID=62062 RepID=A0A4W5LML6_9TELE